MGTTKSEKFTKRQNETAALFKALAHPARIAILEYLLKAAACICGDIVSQVALAQPTVSQHLKELKAVGLIKGTIEGKAVCYCVDDKVLDKLRSYLAGTHLKSAASKEKCC